MSNLYLTLVALTLCASHLDAARMVAKRVSVHHQSLVAVLTEQQQKFRKASESAEANMVCRKPEIKNTINADLSVDGVTDINWDSVQATADDGMKQIMTSISTLSAEIEELEKRIRELEEAGKWGSMGPNDLNDMLEAACKPIAAFAETTESCTAVVNTDCGWESRRATEDFEMPPWDEPIAAFTTSAKSKITGYTKLSTSQFRDHCAKTLDSMQCLPFCDEFAEVVRSLASEDSAEVLGNKDTLDEVKAARKIKLQQLASAEAEKDACSQAQTQLNAFRAQLGKLSGNYASSKSAVNRYRRMLRMQMMQLKRQIQILEQKKELLERAKRIFAAASEQVRKRQEDVEHMEGVIADLKEKLIKQMELIAKIEAKIADIDAATETGRLFKIELSRLLSNAVDTLVQSIHKPLELLQVRPGKNIAADFDAAEEGAAPGMRETVRAVASYCAQEDTSNALTSPLVKLEGSSEELNFICVGQDWNNMISEAQASVRGSAKQVVDLLTVEQTGVVSDNQVPVAASMALRTASGEPKGLHHAVAAYGGKGGSFVDGYINPGWTVDVSNGEVGTIGKMLKLYQKLGEAAELMDQQWEEAKAGARALEAQITDALEQLEKLQDLLRQAIKAKEIAENNMNEAQKVVDENEAIKKKMEDNVAASNERVAKGDEEVENVKDALLKEHRERAAALLEVLQEMKASTM